MALTRRKEIMDQLLYLMGQLSTLACAVRHRDTAEEPFGHEEVPALSVRDGAAAVAHNTCDDEHALPVRLELHTTSRVSVDGVDELVGDVLAVIEVNGTWAGLADGTTVEGHDIDLAQLGDTINSGTIDITIHYTTPPGRA